MAQKGSVIAGILLAGAVVAARQTPPSAPPQPSQPATGVIVGQVVDADSGKGIGESIVTLVPVGSGPINPLTALSTSPKVLTDSTGRFVFRDLPKGRYMISSTKPGHVTGNYGKLSPRGPGTQLELADGERVLDARLTMWKHAAIVGRVVDEAGEPVVGVEMRVRRIGTNAGRPGYSTILQRAVYTDDRGVYRVPSLEPGAYLIGIASTSTTVAAPMIEQYFRATGATRAEMQQALFAAAPSMSSPGSSANQVIGEHILQVEGRMPTPPAAAAGESPAIYPAVYFPNTTRVTEATAISLKSGETRAGIDLAIRPVKTVRISGRLEGDPASVGIATLFLVQANGDQPLGTMEEATATAVSDASGSFTFLGVPQGQYKLFVMKWPVASAPAVSQATVVSGPGGTSSRGVVTDAVNEKPAAWAQQQLTVGERDLNDVAVLMRPGLTLHGRMVVEGAGQAPPAGRIFPFLEPSAQWLRSISFGEASPGPDATFNLAGAPAGRYLLTVPVPSGWYVKSAMSEGRDLVDLPFDLTNDIREVVVTVSNRGATVSGTARPRDPKDPSPSVMLFPTDPRYWVDFSSYARRIREMRTGRDGSFSLPDLPAGDYFIVAFPGSMDWSQPGLLERLSQVATKITLAEGEARTMTLQAAQVR